LWFVSLENQLCYYDRGKIKPFKYNKEIVIKPATKSLQNKIESRNGTPNDNNTKISKLLNKINQGIRNHLMDLKPVESLIEYCRELEDEVVENKQKNDQTIILKQLISEINKSCFELLEDDKKSERWSNDFEKIDFKESIVNLREYIIKYCLDNKINL
jgi:hypothetical protein